MSVSFPEGLESCDPKQRAFPSSWKESYVRIYFNEDKGGYVCPHCQEVFRGTEGFKELEADHISTFSKGGLTTWENMKVLCVTCNRKKSNR